MGAVGPRRRIEQHGVLGGVAEDGRLGDDRHPPRRRRTGPSRSPGWSTRCGRSSCRCPRPAGPSTVNGISSCGPASGSPVFSAGIPAGLASVIGACGGPRGSRPWRPATAGRVDGLTATRSARPSVVIVYSQRVREQSADRPMLVPKSSFQTGEVAVMKLFVIVSVEPAGARPRDQRVVASGRPWPRASRSRPRGCRPGRRRPPGARPRYSATTPVSYGGWNSFGPISNVKPRLPAVQNVQSSVEPVVS